MICIRYHRNSLEEVSKIDLCTINKNELKEVSEFLIDTNLPIEQRIKSFLKENYTPYCFLVESNIVKIEFSDSGNSLQTLLKIHFIEQRKHIMK